MAILDYCKRHGVTHSGPCPQDDPTPEIVDCPYCQRSKQVCVGSHSCPGAIREGQRRDKQQRILADAAKRGLPEEKPVVKQEPQFAKREHPETDSAGRRLDKNGKLIDQPARASERRQIKDLANSNPLSKPFKPSRT
jgi:hypothetical protein